MDAGAGGPARRLFVYNGGLLLNRRHRRILASAGWDVTTGLPRAGDAVGVWGRSPTAHRGEAMAARRGADLVRIEDAFLRSVKLGRDGAPPLGLLVDRAGVHFDPATPSELETLLARHPLDDADLLRRARNAMDRLRRLDLSKYNTHDPDLEPPAPGYALVIDQTRGDASVVHGGGTPRLFREMLAVAQIENPGAHVLVKTHPETRAGHRPGHYGADVVSDRVSLCDAPVSPWALLEGAVAVYTVSSQMGFEAILAGHKPRIFGQPFYGGWGLTADENPVPRRERRLTRAQLFAAAMILYPAWYDPFRDRACELEDAIDILAAQVRAWREDRRGYVASGMRLWKRRHIARIFGAEAGVRFIDDPGRAATAARAAGRPLLVWAGKLQPGHLAAPEVRRVEDGFLRSRGLGAELVPPLSVVSDRSGIYYDPAQPSDLERLIAASVDLPDDEIERSEQLIRAITARKLSKYNNRDEPLPELPTGHRVLVPGQVEDDASIETGARGVRSNLGLLQAVRAARPDAVIVYKPHPDVEAGLRAGALDRAACLELADAVAENADPARLMGAVDEVWTLTSLMGFEALLRGLPVTCLGAPFYAGWGLTEDLGPGLPAARRTARPGLAQLAHAALIGYPRYFDPATGQPCPVEVVVERLASGQIPSPGPANRLLAKAQGALASFAPLWR